MLVSLRAAAQTETALPDVIVRSAPAVTARENVPGSLGVRTTAVPRSVIEALPQGGSTPLNQVLLQTPGVVQDSFGDIHIRGEHRNLQYRINGIALPEGLSGFGQLFDARAFSSVNVLTGALPAQYGFRTNAVVDLRTRREAGGEAGVYGGSRGLLQPYANYGGLVQGWDVFATGSWTQSAQGIENPTSSWRARHDATQQARGLGYAARALDEDTRLMLLAGTAQSRFEIPTRPGLPAAYSVNGTIAYQGTDLRSRQWERTSFGIAALQKQLGDLDVQTAIFLRQSGIHYLPSGAAELALNGVAGAVRRGSTAIGNQTDATWRPADDHTLRFGLQATREATSLRSASLVLPLDADGAAQDQPFTLYDRSDRSAWTYGLYVQDEWRLTDTVTLNAGLRADQVVAQVAAGQLSPRLNVVWRPAEGTTLYGGYARTFTPPQFELVPAGTLAQFQGTTNAPYSLRNDAARPERAHRFELGLSQRVDEALTLGVAAYWKEVQDLLDYGQFGNALIFTPFNYRQGRVYGTEFTANWQRGDWLLYGNLALSRSQGRDIRSGQFNFAADELAWINRRWVRTDHDQTVTASGGAVWRAWEGARLSSTMLYGSGLRRGFANSEKGAAYATFNLGLAQEFELPKAGRWTARLDLLNVFDSIVQLRDGSGIGVGAPQFVARRGVFAGLSTSF